MQGIRAVGVALNTVVSSMQVFVKFELFQYSL